MRKSTIAALVLVLTLSTSVEPQSEREQAIIDAIGSAEAVEIATMHMNTSPETARGVSSDPAVPGPGMLDVDPLSKRGEWYVYYETNDREMCRAVAATVAAAIMNQHSSGEWLIDTSCQISKVSLTLNLNNETASGRQWDSPDGYLWEGEWNLREPLLDQETANRYASGTVNVRACRSTSCSVIEQLECGEEVGIAGLQQDWVRVIAAERDSAFVARRVLQREPMPGSACSPDPADVVARNLGGQARQMGFSSEFLRTKDNPRGEGVFVYSSRTRFAGVRRTPVWFQYDGTVYAMNGPAHTLTQGELPWPFPRTGERSDWQASGLLPSPTSAAVKILY